MNGFTFVTRHHVLSRPTYWFEIDEYKREGDQFLLVHLRVAHWSPSTLKQIIRDFRIFRACVKAPLYACAADDTPQWEKFVTLLGYMPLTTVICENGVERRLFINVHKEANVWLSRNQNNGDPILSDDPLGSTGRCAL